VKKIMMAIMFLIICSLFPVSAQAAYFTPDIEEGKRLILFTYPRYDATQHSGNLGANSWGINYGEQVRVDELMENGWCKVHYTSPKTGMRAEGYLLMRMLTPVPGDQQAAELRATFDERIERENQVIKWGLIILGIGLLVSFLGFLGPVRVILTALALLALSALQIHFLRETSGFGFTFFLPSVFGWKWAAIWFSCFAVFFVGQIYLFFKTLNLIEYLSGMLVQGSNMILIISIIIFYALYLLAALLSGLGEWFFLDLRVITKPFEWVDANFMYIFLGIQALIVIYIIINAESKLKAVFGIAPMYVVGYAAIIMMLQSMSTVVFIAGILLSVVMAGMGDVGDIGLSPQAQADLDARRRHEKAALDAKGALGLFRVRVLGWRNANSKD